MKRMIAVLLFVVMLLMLTACDRSPKGTDWQFVVINGETVRLVYNYDEQTITAGGDYWGDETVSVVGDNVFSSQDETPQEDPDVYRYSYSNDGITITYPNGATWWESSTAGGWDDHYDPQRYIDGEVLALHLKQAYYDAKDRITLDGRILVGSLFLMIVGAIMAYDPETMVTRRMRWWVKDPEPTEYALRSTRFMGIFFGGMGALILLAAIFL